MVNAIDAGQRNRQIREMTPSAREHTVSERPGSAPRITPRPYRLLLLAGYVLVLAVVVGVLAVAVITAFDGFDSNADAMYLPALYHDLASGVPTRYWRVPAVAGFFPDMPLMFSILWITGQKIALSFVIYGVVIMLLLGAAIVYLIRGLAKPPWWSVLPVYAVLYLWVMILLVGPDGRSLLLYVLMPSFHSGTLVAGTLFLALTIRLFHDPSSRVLMAAWILVAGLCIVSDALFLVQYFVPVLICLYVFRRSGTFHEGLPLIKTLLLCILSAATVFATVAWARRLFTLGGDRIGPMIVQVTELGPLFRDTYGVLEPLIKSNLAAVFLSVSGFLLALGSTVGYFWARYKKVSKTGLFHGMSHHYELGFCMLFCLVSGVASLLFPVLTNYTHRPSVSIMRYFLPLYVHPALILGICVSALFLAIHHNTRIQAIVVGAIFLGCAVSTGLRAGDLLPKHLCATPEFVKYLDDLHELAELSNGLGSYWLAKPTCLLSGKGMRIEAIWFPSGVFGHIGNYEWYLVPGPDGKKRLRKYEFIIPYDKCPEALIVAKFGPPAVTYELESRIAVLLRRCTKAILCRRWCIIERAMWHLGIICISLRLW